MFNEKECYERSMAIIKEAEENSRHRTKEEALQNLIDAGILDKNGNFTKPYKNLGRYIRSHKK